MENVTLPLFYCPFPSAINRHAEIVQQRSLDWACRFHLVTDDVEYRRLCVSRFGWLAAYTYPNASLEALQLISDWCVWLFIRDDQCDEAGLGKQPNQLKRMHAHFLAILKCETTTQTMCLDAPLSQGLRDLQQRMLRLEPNTDMAHFIRRVEEFFAAGVWESRNRAKGVIPTMGTYIKMRPFTGGLYAYLELIMIVDRIHLTPAVRAHITIQRLTRMAINTVCWANDIISLERELQQGDVHNLVLALRHRYRITLQEAINRTAEMHDTEMRAFMDLALQVSSVGALMDADVNRYIAILRSMMRGSLDWAYASGRHWSIETVAVV